MGKRAREKRERQRFNEKKEERLPRKEKGSSVLLAVITWATYLILFTPLVVSKNYFFPFVAPKSLYFMALAQVIFFAWVLLAIRHSEYRPKLNTLSIALFLFFLVFVLSAFFGEDLSRSFWSKYERMAGVLVWLHLLGFFLAISTVFKKWADWSKIFIVSISFALLVSLISLFIKAGSDFLGPLTEASRGGATLGNTSFMGTYLLFNIFLALYLFLKSKGGLRIYSAISMPIMFLTIYLANARAATLSILIGMGLLFLLYLAFASRAPAKSKEETLVSSIFQKRYLSILAKIGLIGIVIVFLMSGFFVFQPDNFVHNWFVKKATYARLVVWQGGWQGFLERPLLGWGPENFELVFSRHFDPCMFLRECGGEIWFDRAHNIVVDTLAANGTLGMIAYFGVFLSFFYVLWRPFFLAKKEEDQSQKIDFWAAGIFSVALIAYFIQNLTVFDMISSYLMLFLVLSFVSSLVTREREGDFGFSINSKKQVLSAIVLILFIFSFFKFVIQPTQANKSVIEVLRIQSPVERAELAEKTLKTSSLAKYQVREIFAERGINFLQSQEANNFSIEEVKVELDFLARELEKSKKESPLDFKVYLRLGKIYNLYSQIDPAKIFLAEQASQRAIELSPTNQQAYWELAQAKAYQQNFQEALSLAEKAVELEPRLLNSHLITVQLARFMGDENLIEEKIREALEIDPQWQVHFENQPR